MRAFATTFTIYVGCLCVIAGCGSADAPRASISGKVSYKGGTIPSGTIAFVSGSTVVTGQIQNGQYTIPNVAIGENQISVTTPPPPSVGQEKQMKQKVEGKSFSGDVQKSVEIPAKYSNPETSGLTYTVTAEKTQTHDIELKD